MVGFEDPVLGPLLVNGKKPGVRYYLASLFMKQSYFNPYNKCIVAVKQYKIMETLYFVLGALSVVTLIAVVSVFKIRKEMDQMVEDRLDQTVNHLSSYIEKVERYSDAVESRIDSEVYKLHEYVDQLHDNATGEMDKLYGYVDSRTDKMADSVSKHIAEINQTLGSLTK